jgi:hypothetical protein
MLKSGNRIHSAGTLRGSVRMYAAIRERVHTQIGCVFWHVVYLCCTVSFCVHRLHLPSLCKFMLWRREFVGKMSWTTVNHVVRICFDKKGLLMFRQTDVHFTSGNLFCMRMPTSGLDSRWWCCCTL